MPRLSGTSYLVLSRSALTQPHLVRLSPDVESALTGWSRSTRLSPVFGVVSAERSSPDLECTFDGEWFFLFLGPVHPGIVDEVATPSASIYATFGLYNIFACFSDAEERDALCAWATGEDVPWEAWDICDGAVVRAEPRERQASVNVEGVSEDIRLLAVETSNKDELNEAVLEYSCTLLAALGRRSSLAAPLEEDLCNTAERLTKRLRNWSASRPHYKTLGAVLTVNAGLSRLSSQTFCGNSPIFETESHFWPHSLLGIGTAGSGLRNLVRFFERNVGGSLIPQRVKWLESKTTKIPDLQTPAGLEVALSTDYLAQAEVDEALAANLPPLVTFFSARDGYRSTESTISAPLATIDACNDSRWSLLTLTHEVSHQIVRGVLADIYGKLDCDENVGTCLDLLSGRDAVKSVHDEVRRAVLISVHLLQCQAEGMNERAYESAAELKEAMQAWYPDVNETMVHVFDFHYFYGGNVEKYVADIWTTWGVIPNMRNRVRDYLVRTIVAVSSAHLRKGLAGERASVELVKTALEALDAAKVGGGYPKEALAMLERERERIERSVRARRPLAIVARAFLFSEQVSTSIRREKALGSGKSKTEGYDLDKHSLDAPSSISNPHFFIEQFTKGFSPSQITSLWMYYILAFSVELE